MMQTFIGHSILFSIRIWYGGHIAQDYGSNRVDLDSRVYIPIDLPVYIPRHC